MSIINRSDMIWLYKNELVKNFILEFFKVRKGFRCRVRYGDKPFYYDDFSDASNLIPIREGNYEYEMRMGTTHFLEYIFDRDVVRNEVLNEINSHIIGITAVMNIYVDNVGGVDNGDNRFFDKKVAGWFEDVIDVVDTELREVGEKYNIMFNGNGIYIISEVLYFDEAEDNDKEYVDNYLDLIQYINKELEKMNIGVVVDERYKSWNMHYKIPFSGYTHRGMIAIPIGKDFLDDIEWLKWASYINNMIYYNSEGDVVVNEDLVREIITRAKWKVLW